MTGRKEIDGKDASEKEARPDSEWVVNQVAHALRNPIFAAMMQCDVVSRRSAEPDTVRKCADSLRAQLDRLENTIDEMLLYGRTARINPIELSLAHLLHDLAEAYRQGVRRGPAAIQIVTPEADLRSITPHWDADVVRRILERLLDNVADHTPTPHSAGIVVVMDADRVHITITDDGPGIPEDIMRIALLPFSPQHRGRPGLGLAVADKLARAAGGTIRLSQATGRGCEVVVELPIIMESHDV